MTGNLKKIYDNKDKFDIYNEPSYRFRTNPIYQVNSFITGIDKDLTRNLKNNLEDLIVINDNSCGYISEYDYAINTLYCNKQEGDIFGLLQVASNDRTKKNIGIVIEGEIGYGLNNGLTEVFRNEMLYCPFAYPLEATVAKALLMIDKNLVTYSYFNNNGELLKNISENIKTLMDYIDRYHDNTISMLKLHRECFINKINILKTPEHTRRLKVLEKRIYQLQCETFGIVYYIFDNLTEIIKNSNLNEWQKQDLYVRLTNEFKYIFNTAENGYLYELTHEIKKYVRKW